MCVAHDHLERPMPEQFCHCAQIHSGHYKSTGKCRTDAMSAIAAILASAPSQLGVDGFHLIDDLQYRRMRNACTPCNFSNVHGPSWFHLPAEKRALPWTGRRTALSLHWPDKTVPQLRRIAAPESGFGKRSPRNRSRCCRLFSAWPAGTKPRHAEDAEEQKQRSAPNAGMVLRQNRRRRMGPLIDRRDEKNDSVESRQHANEEPYRQHTIRFHRR